MLNTTMKYLLLAVALTLTSSLSAAPLISAAQLQSGLAEDVHLIIDLRSSEQYQRGHIPGAISAPYWEAGWRQRVDGTIDQLPVERELASLLGGLGVSPESSVVLIGSAANAHELASVARVYWTFKVAGHANVSALDGGMHAWSQAGFAFERDPNQAQAAEPYPVAWQRQYLADSSAVLAAVAQEQSLLLDARESEFYQGQAKHPDVRSYGAITSAQPLVYTQFINEYSGQFLAAEAVEDLLFFQDLDLSSSSAVISYCNSGHWSALVWFSLAEIAGYDNVQIYDGSMVGWSRLADAPMINTRSRWQILVDALRDIKNLGS